MQRRSDTTMRGRDKRRGAQGARVRVIVSTLIRMIGRLSFFRLFGNSSPVKLAYAGLFTAIGLDSCVPPTYFGLRRLPSLGPRIPISLNVIELSPMIYEFLKTYYVPELDVLPCVVRLKAALSESRCCRRAVQIDLGQLGVLQKSQCLCNYPPNHSTRLFMNSIFNLSDFTGKEYDPMHTLKTSIHLANSLDRFILARASCRHAGITFRRFGTTDNYKTEYTERLHIELARDAYRFTVGDEVGTP
ncbi:hypothetical protein DFH06DRAFT_1432683 [Mycena polygramma]|nr:hypothetical protein DFH06DRAFT_1432683 [Mycena polygramma]